MPARSALDYLARQRAERIERYHRAAKAHRGRAQAGAAAREATTRLLRAEVKARETAAKQKPRESAPARQDLFAMEMAHG